jgi:hypothetical protein
MHEVQLKVDWAQSAPLSVDPADDEEVRRFCESAANALTVFYSATFGRKRYIRLRRA